jgi:hypothetical protein
MNIPFNLPAPKNMSMMSIKESILKITQAVMESTISALGVIMFFAAKK